MAKKKKNLKKNILVTGGSGFIGSAITKYLVKKGKKVIVFDNNSRGRARRLKDVQGKLNLSRRYRDRKKLQINNVETVIHLAYVNGTKFFIKNHLRY